MQTKDEPEWAHRFSSIFQRRSIIDRELICCCEVKITRPLTSTTGHDSVRSSGRMMRCSGYNRSRALRSACQPLKQLTALVLHHSETRPHSPLHLVAAAATRGFYRWHGGSAVRALDTRPKGPRFNSQLVHYQVTTLGKLFTPMSLCRCKWTSSWCQNS